MIDEVWVCLTCNPDLNGIFIEATVTDRDQSARCSISCSRTNVVFIEVDGEALSSEEGGITSTALDFTPEEIFGSVAAITEKEIEMLFKGINVNLRIAEFGLNRIFPSKEVSSDFESGSLGYRIRRYCLAASAAIMSAHPCQL